MVRELFRFDAPDVIVGWSAIDDRVMGGRSRSALRKTGAACASFSGEVSLANGGGFASVRSAPQDLGAPGARAYALEVRGDGQRYKLALRTDDAFDGISYQAAFVAPAAAFTTILLPLSAFVAELPRARHAHPRRRSIPRACGRSGSSSRTARQGRSNSNSACFAPSDRGSPSRRSLLIAARAVAWVATRAPCRRESVEVAPARYPLDSIPALP